ncbi:hypothetical protein TREMEDRAFT_36398 [Tremella mesenterica DSM 1558]|uniref:uncharacterized protein n=1 Tax=Tremella mesenterica (strain ATCC 24925 / CBS 8224 / DSM 1558 / NBRC 9311 / NRRL Y-6157 / RJB 2259-6 / UBC 559-6) TaxID=578456 RepID=UPI0003F4970E|nr:uncharacterized protein TREMEDRAFT_36398 [Tremella mesenterica DSM 1558]EIW72066.1 hypothetical protein TREMEDRAFT_36398 [Tremella mesenterica DSM 1558]
MSSDGEDYYYEDDYDEGSMDQDSPVSEGMSEPDIVYDVMSPTADEPAPKKPYDVSYKVRTLQEIINMQSKEVRKIQTLLEMPASTATILLRHYQWNSEKLQEQFWNDPAAALLSAGLSPPVSPSTRTAPQPSGPFECPVCCMEFAKEDVVKETFALGCRHRFCRGCWAEYLTGKIRSEGESSRIQCMESGCERIVREEIIDELVPAADEDRYHNLLNMAFVADAPNLRWCPHPDCEYIIECTQAPPRMLNQLVPTVECNCGRQLCFGCGYLSSHRPVLCKIVRLWERKCADDSETANWLQANTKECSKCQSTIEKNGGCNHMTCKKCKYEFCWVCMGPWSEHGTSWYQCNRFDEKSGVNARDAQAKSRASLERYLHYFNRWANHEHSAKLDAEFYKNTEKKMEQMQNSGNLSWIEVQFAKQAVETVIKARITLKWSYCMAFYLKRNNMTELFEDNQRDLERAVENLGFALEQNIEPDSIAQLRQDITNQTAYVQKRHEILMDDTLKGYLERRWDFSVDI